jgi:hypothetical protein
MAARARADTATLLRHPQFLAGEVVDEFGSARVVIALVVVEGLLDKPSAGNEGSPKGRLMGKAPFPGPFEVAGAGFEPATSGL